MLTKYISLFKNLENSISYKSHFLLASLIGVVTGFLESLNIFILIPIIELVVNTETNTSIISQYFEIFFSKLNLEMNLVNLCLTILFFFSLKFLLNLVEARYVESVIYTFSINLKNKLFTKINSLEWEVAEKQKSGQISSSLTLHFDRLVKCVRTLINFITCLIILLILILSSILNEPIITCLALILGAIKVVLFLKLNVIAQNIGLAFTKTTEALSININAYISNLKFLRFTSKDYYLVEKVKNYIKLYTSHYRKRILNVQYLKIFGDYFNFLIFLIILILSLITFKISISSFAVLLIFLNRIVNAISTIQKCLISIDDSISASDKILSLHDEYEKSQMIYGKKKVFLKKSITLKNVEISLGKSLRFKNLNLKLNAKKIFLIKGVSGSGKSIFIESLLGLRKVRSGKIIIDNQILNSPHINLKHWLSRIGYVSNENFIFNDTLKNNLIFNEKNFTNNNIYKGLKIAGIYEDLKNREFSLEQKLFDKGKNFSVGQSQRLNIARAILLSKEILIIDEGLANIDISKSIKIVKEIKKLNKTVFIVSHSNHLDNLVDYIIKLSLGKITLTEL